MCPLCITAGTLYLASLSAGSAGGLAAVTAKVMRGRKGHKDRSSQQPDPDPKLHPCWSESPGDATDSSDSNTLQTTLVQRIGDTVRADSPDRAPAHKSLSELDCGIRSIRM
jgi:hypothetical protein